MPTSISDDDVWRFVTVELQMSGMSLTTSSASNECSVIVGIQLASRPSQVADATEQPVAVSAGGRSEMILPKLVKHAGHDLGVHDSCALGGFSDASVGVGFALGVVDTADGLNAGLPPHERINLSVGVAARSPGAITENVMSDAMKLACSLTGFADHHGVAVCGEIFDQLAHQSDFSFQFLRELPVSWRADPTRIYRIWKDPAHRGGQEPGRVRLWDENDT